MYEDYSSQLQCLEKVFQHRPADSRGQTTYLEILGKSRDENLLSRILAHFLRIGAEIFDESPMASLLNMVAVPFDKEDLGDVRVVPEHTFNDQESRGRIDLLVEIGDSVVVGIENKIDAEERMDQTVDYWMGLQAEFPDHDCYGILLSPDGRSAGSSEFLAVSYSNLVSAFRGLHLKWVRDVQQGVIWEDFLQHLERHVASQNSIPKRDEAVDLFLEHREMIEKLSGAYEEYRRRLAEHIADNAKEILSDGDDEYTWDTRMPRSLDWQQIKRANWKGSIGNLDVHYEYNRIGKPLERPMRFMVDVEGERALVKEFLSTFSRRREQFTAEYENKGIEFLPKGRWFALAWKEYPAVDSIDELVEQCKTAAREFEFLTPIIEETFRAIEPSG